MKVDSKNEGGQQKQWRKAKMRWTAKNEVDSIPKVDSKNGGGQQKRRWTAKTRWTAKMRRTAK